MLLRTFFHAQIEICLSHGDNRTLSEQEIRDMIGQNCQAVILLCNSVDSSAFDTIAHWNQLLQEYVDNIETKMVLFSHNDIQNAITESNSAKQKAWCTENLYEFIPCNLRMPHFTWKDQEKQGVARVVENLECVMWLSMDRSQRRVDERVIDESIIMNNSESDQCAFCHKSKSVDGVPLYRCSRCRIMSYFSRECQVKDWKNHKAFCNQVAGYDPEAKAKKEEEQRLKEAESSIIGAIPAAPKTKEEEDMERFSKLIADCRSTKEMAKSLPDDERRKRAAAITARVMRELNLGTEEEARQIEEDLKNLSLWVV